MDSEKKIWKYTSEVVLKVYMSLIKGKGKAKRRQAKGEKKSVFFKIHNYLSTYM